MAGAADHEWRLNCRICGTARPLAPLVLGCPECVARGVPGLLEASFTPRRSPRPLAERQRPRGLDAYRDLLPGGAADQWISLGAGGTPLVPSRRIGPRLGLARLYFKNETANPTWSFKDRYVAVSLNLARQFGYRRVVVTSTGNLGVAVAAYAAALGLECLFIVPHEASPLFIRQGQAFGAQIVVTSRAERQRAFEHVGRRPNWFPVGLFLPRRVQNPFGIEGYKTFAYELIADLDAPAAAVLFPCARANGLYGAWKGYEEARIWDWCAEPPAMVACQPAGGNSLEVALRKGVERVVELAPVASVAVSANETVASDQALAAIRASGGTALSAGDDAITAAVADLAEEGLSVETSSALPVACLPQLIEQRIVDPARPIVCVLTAAGIKWPEQLVARTHSVHEVGSDLGAFDRMLNQFERSGARSTS